MPSDQNSNRQTCADKQPPGQSIKNQQIPCDDIKYVTALHCYIFVIIVNSDRYRTKLESPKNPQKSMTFCLHYKLEMCFQQMNGKTRFLYPHESQEVDFRFLFF